MGEVKDIVDKIKKYGGLKVAACLVGKDHLSTEANELLGEIEEDLKQLVQDNDWPRRDNLPVENYD